MCKNYNYSLFDSKTKNTSLILGQMYRKRLDLDSFDHMNKVALFCYDVELGTMEALF